MNNKGRKRKVSTESLMEIIQLYVQNIKYITKLKKVDLVEYAKHIGYENIISQDFIRNKEVNDFIKEYNKQYLEPKKYKIKDEYNEMYLDVDTIVDSFHTNKNGQKAILNTFNENYDELIAAFNKLKKERVQLLKLMKENESEIKEIKLKNKEKQKIIEEQKIKIEKFKNKLKEKKKIDNEKILANSIKYLIEKKCCRELTKDDVLSILQGLKIKEVNEYDQSIFINLANKNSDIKKNNIIKLKSENENNIIKEIDENIFD